MSFALASQALFDELHGSSSRADCGGALRHVLEQPATRRGYVATANMPDYDSALEHLGVEVAVALARRCLTADPLAYGAALRAPAPADAPRFVPTSRPTNKCTSFAARSRD
jgi:hypothetical protein